MILVALLRRGLLRSLDAEKLRFFLGWTANPLYLSRRCPLYRRLGPALLLSPRYARGVAEWLRYRADLYDGRRARRRMGKVTIGATCSRRRSPDDVRQGHVGSARRR